jgi:hypothetical protein
MQAYRITFSNNLTNDSGHCFCCCQRVIEIRAAKTRDRAIAAAKRRFERREGVSDWRIRAEYVGVEELAPLALTRVVYGDTSLSDQGYVI